jgi:hypothetical protein
VRSAQWSWLWPHVLHWKMHRFSMNLNPPFEVSRLALTDGHGYGERPTGTHLR